MQLIKELIGKNFRQPKGLLGHWAARFMGKRNQDYYGQVIQVLKIKDQDRILEIGFGAGLAIRKISEQNSGCRIWGLDFSKLMLKKAVKNNQAAIRQKRIELRLGDIREYDFKGQKFTKILGINVIYFWENLPIVFNRLYALLEPGGCLVLFMSSPERLEQMPFAVEGVFNKYPAGQVMERLKQAGFCEVGCQTIMKKGFATYVLLAQK